MNKNIIIPFKKRVVKPNAPVEVYRCLNRQGRVFSIRQNGYVVGHTNRLLLEGCEFVVGRSGKERAIRTKQRNVHAYIRGYISDKPYVSKAYVDNVLIKYNPFADGGFFAGGVEVKRMSEVLVHSSGVRVGMGVN